MGTQHPHHCLIDDVGGMRQERRGKGKGVRVYHHCPFHYPYCVVVKLPMCVGRETGSSSSFVVIVVHHVCLSMWVRMREMEMGILLLIYVGY